MSIVLPGFGSDKTDKGLILKTFSISAEYQESRWTRTVAYCIFKTSFHIPSSQDTHPRSPVDFSRATCTNTAAAQVEDAGQKLYGDSRLKDRIPFLTAWEPTKVQVALQLFVTPTHMPSPSLPISLGQLVSKSSRKKTLPKISPLVAEIHLEILLPIQNKSVLTLKGPF